MERIKFIEMDQIRVIDVLPHTQGVELIGGRHARGREKFPKYEKYVLYNRYEKIIPRFLTFIEPSLLLLLPHP